MPLALRQRAFGPNRNPVGKKPGFLGFSQKPGFLGVRVDRMSVLAPPRNPVGKKPGFLPHDRNQCTDGSITVWLICKEKFSKNLFLFI